MALGLYPRCIRTRGECGQPRGLEDQRALYLTWRP